MMEPMLVGLLVFVVLMLVVYAIRSIGFAITFRPQNNNRNEINNVVNVPKPTQATFIVLDDRDDIDAMPITAIHSIRTKGNQVFINGVEYEHINLIPQTVEDVLKLCNRRATMREGG
jgi:hypothetical protein